MTPKRKRNSLSAVFVQSVQKAGTYSGGGGLNLRVGDSGTKYWFQRVTIDGKRRNLGLGGYPTVSLAEARKDALSNSRMIREGRDPLAEKREAIEASPSETTHADLRCSGGNRDRNAPPKLDERETRRPMDQYAHHLRSPRDWGQVGFRHHQRGHPGRPVANVDGETRDGQSGAPAGGNGSGLGCRPRLSD